MNTGIVLCVVAAMLATVILIIKLASFLRIFNENTRHICCEMDRADSYEEYRLWRGELRCHYLCLIPFVNEKNVMQLYDRIFHRADHAKTKERKDGIALLLMPSILGICICIVCLCGMTWAWYSANVQSPTQKITGAYYKITVGTVLNGNVPVGAADGSYELVAKTAYTITLQASGSVEECGGYCLIQCQDTKYYTQTFKPGESITITLTPVESGAYTFTGVWGSVPSGVDIIKANAENGAAGTTNDPQTDAITTAPFDPAETAAEETTAENSVIPEPGPTVPQEAVPAESESDPTPTESSDSVPSDTPVTEPAPAPVTDSSAVTDESTDFDTDASATDAPVSAEE